jgi:Nose resistant-to-fluoxetine protein, N-terminal domain
VHDSKAKLPAGILRGNVHQYGDFDECLSSIAPDKNFRGKYCLANIQMIIPENLELLKNVKAEFVLEELFTSNFTDVSFLL